MGKEGIRGVGEGFGGRDGMRGGALFVVQMGVLGGGGGFLGGWDGMRGGACIFVAARRSRTCELTNNCG